MNSTHPSAPPVTMRNATLADVSAIHDIAEKTWWPAYSDIVGHDQIVFMLNLLYREETLSGIIASGQQQFVVLEEQGVPMAFAAYGPRENDGTVIKLHKLYVLPECHGRGYGAMLIGEIKRRMTKMNLHVLDLNVNRNNKAKHFYERMGFTVIASEDVPIGPYFMNDYVMRLEF